MRARWRNRPAPIEEWLVVVREESPEAKLRYYLSDATEDIGLEELVRAASARYWVEDCFERAKGEVGLADYETRTWDGWHHHVTLSLLALWFLVKEQRRLKGKTPALTLQQARQAISALLRDPELDTEDLAARLTRRLQRSEQARIGHWSRLYKTPPRHPVVE